MKKHVMLDLETLDATPSALVLSIGAVAFDADTFEIIDTLHVALDHGEQRDAGRTTSATTLDWWNDQSPEAKQVFSMPRHPVYDALKMFDRLAEGNQGMWGNGADFDCVILGSLYASFGHQKPWSYGKNRCLRTIKNVLLPKEYIQPERLGVHHNALDDALYQLAQLKAICTATGIRF